MKIPLTSLQVSHYNEPGESTGGSSFKTSWSPCLMYLYTHGAIKPGPDPPGQIVAANRWPIPFAVPSATLTVSPFGSSPSTSLPVKYCSLISDNASK